MPRTAYVNGRYVPHADASVHVEDRGYQFADGVYEVVAIYNGKLADEQGHLNRLGRSLSEVRIGWPVHSAALKLIMRRLVRLNLVSDGRLYIQITRGVAPRDFKFPDFCRPTIVMTCTATPRPPADIPPIAVKTVRDLRWKRCDIKSVGLLAPVLAKQEAHEAGAAEAWLVDETGAVREGSSSNAWIVTHDDVAVTRFVDRSILRGITRESVLELLADAGLRLEEREFTVEEARRAREAFVTSATTYVTPVGSIDGVVLNGGRAGTVAPRLRRAYIDRIERTGT